MAPARANPVVHLELHTGDLGDACAFYTRLLGWHSELIETRCGSYRALDPGDGLTGGVVDCGTQRPLWLPYVEVPQIAAATKRAQRLGASVLVEPREGPAGWRSVVAAPDAGELAFWEPK